MKRWSIFFTFVAFRFGLPRQGRTVLVHSAKTKKILHKVTWNGEKFVQEQWGE